MVNLVPTLEVTIQVGRSPPDDCTYRYLIEEKQEQLIFIIQRLERFLHWLMIVNTCHFHECFRRKESVREKNAFCPEDFFRLSYTERTCSFIQMQLVKLKWLNSLIISSKLQIGRATVLYWQNHGHVTNKDAISAIIDETFIQTERNLKKGGQVNLHTKIQDVMLTAVE